MGFFIITQHTKSGSFRSSRTKVFPYDNITRLLKTLGFILMLTTSLTETNGGDKKPLCQIEPNNEKARSATLP